MKSSLALSVILGMCALIAGQSAVIGQTEDPPPEPEKKEPEQQQPEQQEPEQAEEPQPDEPAADEPVEDPDVPNAQDDQQGEREGRTERRAATDQIARRLAQLLTMMSEKLDLSPTQRTKIETLFERQIESYKEPSDSEGGPQSRDEAMAKIGQLQQELAEAKESGDRARLREIRLALRDAWKERGPDAAPTIGRFLMVVSRELDEHQVVRFRKMAERLGLGTDVTAALSPLRLLQRAVMNPEVALTREQRKAIREILREYIEKNKQGEEKPDERQKRYESLRDRILAELTEQQREKVVAALAVAVRRRAAAPDRTQPEPEPRTKTE